MKITLDLVLLILSSKDILQKWAKHLDWQRVLKFEALTQVVTC